jgi:hypothetical protein
MFVHFKILEEEMTFPCGPVFGIGSQDRPNISGIEKDDQFNPMDFDYDDRPMLLIQF